MSKSPDYAVGIFPLNAVPVRSPFGYVHNSRLHPTFPKKFGFFTIESKGFTRYTSASFRIGHLTYLPSYDFLFTVGRGSFRFL
ncbi:hypothetical protein [Mastigocoleus testarum]|uniref:hypothetical protein n=1 Tax=Mastigocoleus testarum TaxID=996925 RepID=UPI00190FF154|nr:hypothetical protein [Mastigocoleus testarum]